MSPSPRERARQLFDAVRQKSPPERAAYLKDLESTDPELKRALEALLAATDEQDTAAPPGPSAEDDLPADDSLPERIGPYRVLRQIGKGGMGVVYQVAQDEPVERTLALKLIKVGMDTREVIARFQSERQALALMNHPSIAQVFDAGATEQGRPWFAMEYVSGIPITKYCDQNRLPIRERLELFVRVCEGLQHAHQKGIIHRDIKPSNVLVTSLDGAPAPKIIDFGVAKATSRRLTEDTLQTELGQLIGTPEYMSPEQADLTNLDVDTRTDVYSLGVMLYELLAGVQPFEKKDLRWANYERMRQILRDKEPPRPSTRVGILARSTGEPASNRQAETPALVRELKGDLDWITMKALEKDRTRRYASASELAADIQRYLADEPVEARPPSPRYRAEKFVRRHKAAVLAAAAFVVLLVGVAVTTTYQSIQVARERDRANREAEAARQVSQFLVDLFEVSEPGEAQGNTVTAREILDQGARRISTGLAGQPRTQARLMGTMGKVYARLGLYDQAAPLLEGARELQQTAVGQESVEALGAARELAWFYTERGKLEEAEALAAQALETQRRVLGEDHPETLASRHQLGVVYKVQSRYPDALRELRPTLEARRRVLGEEHSDTLVSANALATLYQDMGRHDDAQALYERALRVFRQKNGDDHPATLTLAHNMASVLVSLGRYEEAEEFARDTLERRRRVLGDEHRYTLTSAYVLGLAVDSLGRKAEAEELFHEVWETQRRVLGKEHPNTLDSQGALAQMIRDQGRLQEAEALQREVLSLSREALGAEHIFTQWSLYNLANTLREQQRYAEAEALYREALELELRTLGPAHPETVDTLYQLGVNEALRGNRAKALDWLRRSVESGFSNSEALQKDADLASLRGDPDFDALVELIDSPRGAGVR